MYSMPGLDFSDATLILVGHGSTRNANSAAPVYRHAATLRQRKLFASVLECFWMVEPKITRIWDSVRTERAFVVPVCISEGYFTMRVIPQALGLATAGQNEFARYQRHGNREVYYCATIGTHPTMTNALLARAADIVRRHPAQHPVLPGEIALIIAGHGTTRDDRSRLSLERQVTLLRERRLYASVQPAFMEEEPNLRDCLQSANADAVVVVPFFISDGLHTVEDIPVMLGEAPEAVQARLAAGQPTWINPTLRDHKTVWYTAAIGSEDHLADIILERVRETCLARGHDTPANLVPG
jgi:sirohydrochlorin cobaltochelatase